MALMMTRRRRATNKGFNLIEAAIVLGIVGLVVGGIWVAATSVYANLRVKKGTDQLLKVAQGVRSLYATSVVTGVAAAGSMSADLGRSNVFDTEMLLVNPNPTANDIGDAWGGGRTSVRSQTNAIAGDSFSITFSQVPQTACVDMLVRNSGNGRDVGLYAVGAAASTAAGVEPVDTAAGIVAFPVTPLAAAAACANAVNNLTFRFQLKA